MRKSQVWYGNVSEQDLLLCKSKMVYCVYTRILSTQDSCACTRFLCMHYTLVRAQHSCACTGGARDQGRDPTKSAGGPAWASVLFGSPPWSLAPPVHAQECCACTRVLCMRKNLVHAQEDYYSNIILSCYHIIFILFLSYHIILWLS